MHTNLNLCKLVGVALMLVLLSACGGAATPTSDVPAGPTAHSILLGPTPQMPADMTTPGIATPPTPEPLKPVGDLHRDTIKGLNSLSSYRLIYTLLAEPRTSSQRSRLETFREIAQGGQNRGERVTQEGAPLDPSTTQQPGAFETLLISGTAYLWTAEPGGANPSCNSFDGGTFPKSTASDPSQSILASIATAKLVQRGETLNDVPVDHYAITTSNGLFGSNHQATGDLWVGQATNVIVKFVAKESGDIGIQTIPQGTLTISYVLEQVNALQNITLPPECVGKQPQP